VLGVCGRTFRRYVDRYEDGLDGLVDKRLEQVFHRRAPVDEVLALTDWVPGKRWDFISTMDDATSEHDSMLFADEEGTQSRFRGVREVIETRGLFSAVLCRLPGGGLAETRPSGDFQQRSRFAIHQRRFYRRAQAGEDRDQYGRAGTGLR